MIEGGPAIGDCATRRALWSIQALRAIAALMIVIGHGQSMVERAFLATGRPFARFTLLPWGSSVDLFFVISGFVMVHASRSLFGVHGGGRVFLLRRLSRVAPLYWLVTCAFLLLLVAASWKGGDRFPGPGAIFASFAFLPFDTWSDDRIFPVFDLGWTLNYELFFYVLFALFVALPRRFALGGVVLALALLVSAGTVVGENAALRFWTRPIVIDFMLGLAVGWLEVEGVRLPRTARLALVAGGTFLFAADPGHVFDVPLGATVDNGFARVIAGGVPATAVLGAAVLGREAHCPRVLAPLTRIGDASYSLYLLHPFALILLEKLVQKSAFVRSAPAVLLVGAVLTFAVLLALASYRWVERPLTRHLTSRRPTPRSTDRTSLRREAG